MDLKLLLLINGEWTHPALDRFMAVMSSFAFWGPLLILAGLVLLVRGGFRERTFLLLAVLAAGVGDGLVSNTLKKAVNRPRPNEALAGIRQIDLGKATPRIFAAFKPLKIKLSKPRRPAQGGRSFPSSHTVNTAAAATVAVVVLGWRWLILGAIPLLVGYSRIYTGSHWPSDVAASLFLGAGVAFLLLVLAEIFWRRLGARVFPRLRSSHPHLVAA